MSRMTIPATVEAAPAPSQAPLTAVKQQLGSVPNLFRLTATSPETLEGYLGLNRALAKGRLDAATRERIALAVAEINGCGYCLAAHAYLAKHIAPQHADQLHQRSVQADVDFPAVRSKVAAWTMNVRRAPGTPALVVGRLP